MMVHGPCPLRPFRLLCLPGLASLALETASGCVVFEEPNRAPLELELSHLARLLAAAAAARGWRVRLGVWDDATVHHMRPRLELARGDAACPLDLAAFP